MLTERLGLDDYRTQADTWTYKAKQREPEFIRLGDSITEIGAIQCVRPTEDGICVHLIGGSVVKVDDIADEDVAAVIDALAEVLGERIVMSYTVNEKGGADE